eukprot:COSAG01_NODE_8013_length_2953_cov_24.441836_1_plen_35_part_00
MKKQLCLLRLQLLPCPLLPPPCRLLTADEFRLPS